MSLRRFHLVQCPAPTPDICTVNSCHWHAEEVTFALLKEFMDYLTGEPLLQVVRQYVGVFDSQVFQQLGKDQSEVENPQHCGQCLLLSLIHI